MPSTTSEVLFRGYKHVSSFSKDMEEEEEEMFVVLDFGTSTIEPSVLRDAKTIRVVGLDTAMPFVQIAQGMVFKGYIDNHLGSELLFQFASSSWSTAQTDQRHAIPQERTELNLLKFFTIPSPQTIRLSEVRLHPKGQPLDRPHPLPSILRPSRESTALMDLRATNPRRRKESGLTCLLRDQDKMVHHGLLVQGEGTMELLVADKGNDEVLPVMDVNKMTGMAPLTARSLEDPRMHSQCLSVRGENTKARDMLEKVCYIHCSPVPDDESSNQQASSLKNEMLGETSMSSSGTFNLNEMQEINLQVEEDKGEQAKAEALLLDAEAEVSK